MEAEAEEEVGEAINNSKGLNNLMEEVGIHNHAVDSRAGEVMTVVKCQDTVEKDIIISNNNQFTTIREWEWSSKVIHSMGRR